MRCVIFLIFLQIAFPKEPFFFSVYNSFTAVSNSVFGNPGKLPVATSFNSTGDFISRIYVPRPLTNFPGTVYYPRTNAMNIPFTNQGTIEWWDKQDNWNLVNGATTDGSERFRAWGTDNAAPYYLYFVSTPGGTHLDNYYLPGWTDNRLTLSTINITSNTWVHWAITWSTNKMVYLNGVLVASTASLGNLTAGIDEFCSLGSWYGSGRQNFSFGGWIANMRVYDYVKTNFDDRFDERSGLNDGVN